MPAKKQITKQKILSAAYGLVREKGMDALNVREVAKRCKCSTQPIYLSFSGVKELKIEVERLIDKRYNEFIREEIDKNIYSEYKASGIGYIRFAKEEKELFKYKFMRNVQSVGNQSAFDEIVRMLVKNYGLVEDKARLIHSEMWVFVHGIATMCATEYFDWDKETISEMLTDEYRGLMYSINGEKL